MKVLSTKTLSPSVFSIVQQKEISLTCIDFIQTKKVPFSAEEIQSIKFDSVAFTSSNAVKYFLENHFDKKLLAGKNIFSLSGKTADELCAHNIVPKSTARNSEKLADAISQDKQTKSVLHPCGNLRLHTLQKKLEDGNIGYRALVVYETVAVNNSDIKENFDAIMFFSPSGVESFCIGNELKKEILYCCIGETTAAAVKRKRNDLTIITSEQTNAKSMIEAIEAYFKATTK